MKLVNKRDFQLKRELQTVKRSYEAVMNYQRAKRELDILRDVFLFCESERQMRKEKQKQLADVNKRLDDLTDALESGITLSRIEKLSGKKVGMSGWSEDQLSKKDLYEEEVKVGKESMGRLVGKNGANVWGCLDLKCSFASWRRSSSFELLLVTNRWL